MARTMEEILREQLGAMSLQIANLVAQLETLRDEKKELADEIAKLKKTEPVSA
jgi:cell division protein FtsB